MFSFYAQYDRGSKYPFALFNARLLIKKYIDQSLYSQYSNDVQLD